MTWRVENGDCIDVLKTLEENSIDACIVDPPYGLGTKEPGVASVMLAWASGESARVNENDFMGKDWQLPGPEYWREVYRVLKPGAHLLCFAGTRTWDLMSIAIRFAGFENRDTIAHHFSIPALSWTQGQGFPKGLDISAAIDKLQCINRNVVGTARLGQGLADPTLENWRFHGNGDVIAATGEDAKRWNGWNVALKPGWEVILCFTKPFVSVELERTLRETNELLGELVWLLLPAKLAERYLKSSQVGSLVETSDSVQLLAALASMEKSSINSGMMDTCRSQEVVSTAWNIASLWNSILDEASQKMSTFTTSTAIPLITALRILNCWILETTREFTPKASNPINGSRCLACGAEQSLNDSNPGSSSIPIPIAAENATGLRDENGSGTSASSAELSSLARQEEDSAPMLALEKRMRIASEQVLLSLAKTAESLLGSSGNMQRTLLTTSAAEIATLKESARDSRPSFEVILMFRKPLSESTVAKNVLAWGTGGINIDACRVGPAHSYKSTGTVGAGRERAINLVDRGDGKTPDGRDLAKTLERLERYKENWDTEKTAPGRWPSNTVFSHSPACRRIGTKRVRGQNAASRGGNTFGGDEAYKYTEDMVLGYADADGLETVEEWECVEGCAVRELSFQSGIRKSGSGIKGKRSKVNCYGTPTQDLETNWEGSKGTASRFFPNFSWEEEEIVPFRYIAKASRRERDAGCDAIPEQSCGMMEDDNYPIKTGGGNLRDTKGRNIHSTVKPLALMKFLVRLITPPGGTVLDPFCGSGSTGCAAVLEGFNFIGIEKDKTEGYVEIAKARIAYWEKKATLQSPPAPTKVSSNPEQPMLFVL